MSIKSRKVIKLVVLIIISGLVVFVVVEQIVFFRRSVTVSETIKTFYEELEQFNRNDSDNLYLPDAYELESIVIDKKYKIPFVSYYTVELSYSFHIIGSERIRYMASNGHYAGITNDNGEDIDCFVLAKERLLIKYSSETWDVWRVQHSSQNAVPKVDYPHTISPLGTAP